MAVLVHCSVDSLQQQAHIKLPSEAFCQQSIWPWLRLHWLRSLQWSFATWPTCDQSCFFFCFFFSSFLGVFLNRKKESSCNMLLWLRCLIGTNIWICPHLDTYLGHVGCATLGMMLIAFGEAWNSQSATGLCRKLVSDSYESVFFSMLRMLSAAYAVLPQNCVRRKVILAYSPVLKLSLFGMAPGSCSNQRELQKPGLRTATANRVILPTDISNILHKWQQRPNQKQVQAYIIFQVALSHFDSLWGFLCHHLQWFRCAPIPFYTALFNIHSHTVPQRIQMQTHQQISTN